MFKKPPLRKLKGYAFDPSLSLKIDTAAINEIVYKVVWEELQVGPVGEYVEIIDYDPTTKTFYKPVNLDDDYILAQDGLEPSESNPLFHQQMVYSVVMTTIKNFEKALGRKVLWSPQRLTDRNKYEEYVRRLRIYPHAFREANAYYSPLKKALLFGYFSSTPANETLHMPDSLVFTCLSHDIIAHETTHAILDGMHGHYNEATNADVLAFHEAFADIVALFQHFTFPEVLKHQIARTKGDLTSQSLLGQLAQEFGSAIGSYGSLRDAIGEVDEKTGQWRPKAPDPEDIRTVMEPHARGSILVSAVFEAFLTIYKSRAADLLRIASNGTGILPQGELHPDLVNRLAAEASKAAGHVLSMSIRALDYCPPVDITFGDYLRAIITADSDIIPEDTRNYRLAFVDAFRRRGIYPEGIKTLSTESLRFRELNIGYDREADKPKEDAEEGGYQVDSETREFLYIINSFLRSYCDHVKYVNKREDIYEITRRFIAGGDEGGDTGIMGLHQRLNEKFYNSTDFTGITGLAFVTGFTRLGIRTSAHYGSPSVAIRNLRLVSRVGPDNTQINQVVFSLIQQSAVRFVGDAPEFYSFKTEKGPDGKIPYEPMPPEYFWFRGGCTLIFDLDTLTLKYAISKPILDAKSFAQTDHAMINEQRLRREYNFRRNERITAFREYTSYFGVGSQLPVEPFAFIHQH